MKKIKFDIPEGFEPMSIHEMSEDGVHYLEVDLIEKKDMCKIPQPHDCTQCNEK